ncbi:vitamin B12 transporter [Halospina denitrificans]|uniref:Vitamin B12 transporter n=1 Tax=Halospina denitrificans TaxID=332522 RepID=A0A4R7K458_9GAMM|nr:TonB-dependent receptor [Halospina denitrificans]TDT44419.1 vitamin B12 transporter [Halospina denitrificans]
MHTNLKTPLALAISLSLAATATNAQESNTEGDFDLDPIVVTSTLGSETVNESLSSVTVIDPEMMERQNPREIADVLQAQPGINLVSNGSYGKTTSVYTRGTGSESTLFLLDGIRIRSATSGGAPWQFIPPQLVNRMEVVRGPRGSLYGADAVGGVVQGFTIPEGDQDRQWAEVGGGSFSTREAGAGASGKEGNTRYSIQGNHVDTEGTRISEGGEDRGFRNAAGSASVEHEFDNGATLGVLGLRSQGKTEFDGGSNEFVVQTLGVKGETPVTEDWTTSVQMSESRDEQEFASGSIFDTRTRTARWENTLDLGRHEWIAGAEYYVDDVDTTANFTEDSRDNTSLFTQLLSQYDRFDTQLSVRWDDNEGFGEEVTGSVAAGYRLDASHRVRASYGTAFRAPTFNDLYFPFTDFGFGFQFEGNEDLDPETSDTVELGVRGQYQNYYWDLALYETNVEDLIQNQADGSGVTRPVNVDEARIRGAELTGGMMRGNWELQSALTLQDPRNRSDDPAVRDNRLRRRTIQSARVDVDYSEGPVSFGVTGIVEGDRYDDAENNDKLPGFATADLRVGVSLTEKLLARFTIDNVFDRQYETAQDDLAAGRAVFASIRYGAP